MLLGQAGSKENKGTKRALDQPIPLDLKAFAVILQPDPQLLQALLSMNTLKKPSLIEEQRIIDPTPIHSGSVVMGLGIRIRGSSSRSPLISLFLGF